jgi:hypothetical protein
MSNRQPTSKDVKYRRCMVSFLDILGFKNLVATSTASEVLDVLRGKATLALYSPVPMKTRGDVLQFRDVHGTRTVSFSDLLVNVTPLRNESPLYPLFDQLSSLGFRQFMLAKRGIFVRGGITLGEIYIDKSAVFGPALIRAYELESVIAKWPIIAIDPELVDWIGEEGVRYLQSRERTEGPEGLLMGRYFLALLNNLISTTTEPVYFLDYLRCLSYVDSTTGDLPYYLALHKQSLVNAYRKHPHWKYDFLAEHHNRFCAKYFPGDANLQVTIPPKDPETRESAPPD